MYKYEEQGFQGGQRLTATQLIEMERGILSNQSLIELLNSSVEMLNEQLNGMIGNFREMDDSLSVAVMNSNSAWGAANHAMTLAEEAKAIAQEAYRLVIQNTEWGGGSGNLQTGTGEGSIQQIPDGVEDGFSFSRDTNAAAVEHDETLNGIVPYGGQEEYSAAFGGKSSAQGRRSFASGSSTVAKGKYSHVEGSNGVAFGTSSHVEGAVGTAIGDYSHVEGSNGVAKGTSSHVEGMTNKAEGNGAHVEGWNNDVKGNYAHGEGSNNIVGEKAHSAHVGGQNNNANYEAQTVFGRYNKNKPNNVMEVGWGDAENNRKNVFEVDKDGEAYAGGVRLLKEGEGINSALFSDLTANNIPFWDGEKFKPLVGLKTYPDGKQLYMEETSGIKSVWQDNQMYLQDTITNAANPVKAHLSASGGLALSNSAKRVIYGYDYIGVDASTGPTFNDYDWQNRKTFRWPTKSGTLALAEDNPERSSWQLLKSVKNKRPSGASYYYTADYYQNISSSTKQMIVLDIIVDSPATLSANPVGAIVMSLGRWNSPAIPLHTIMADMGWGKTLQDFPLLSAESASWIVIKGTGTGMSSFQFNDSGFVVPQMYDAISLSNQATLWGMGVQFSDANANSSLTVKGQRYKVVLLNSL